MPKRKGKDFFCTVVSEDVKIALKTKTSLSRTFNDQLYVKCDQLECQYVDENIAPCPLKLELFAKEIEEREERRKARREEEASEAYY